jgi:excisionase family DNA binding protein
MDRIENLVQEAGGEKYTIGEIAMAGKCAEITVRRAIESGELVAYKQGRWYIFKKDAVRWIRGRRHEESLR